MLLSGTLEHLGPLISACRRELPAGGAPHWRLPNTCNTALQPGRTEATKLDESRQIQGKTSTNKNG